MEYSVASVKLQAAGMVNEEPSSLINKVTSLGEVDDICRGVLWKTIK